jgi:uncharacterized metal-binding protein YceD (DUF177 family)
MTRQPEPRTRIATADLRPRTPTRFALAPDAGERESLAQDLGIEAIRKLRFEGEITAEGRDDWRLDATLGATVVQPCVVTLAPVTTRIDTAVTRRFLARMPDIELDESGEAEMPEDETLEPLGSEIDLAAIMAEALALNLPLYPRADGAELGEAVFAEPGIAPMRDEDAKPFAGLAGLRDRLTAKGGDGEPE